MCIRDSPSVVGVTAHNTPTRSNLPRRFASFVAFYRSYEPVSYTHLDVYKRQGLSLAFQQAILLAEAFARGDLDYYESAHREISRAPWRMTRLLLLMDQSAWLRRKVLRLFAANPALFTKIMSAHMAEAAQDSLKATEVLGLGWQVLRA